MTRGTTPASLASADGVRTNDERSGLHSISSHSGNQVINPQSPLSKGGAAKELTACVGRSAALLGRRQLHHSHVNLGRRLRFANDTEATVYRETVVDRVGLDDPCVLAVAFQLRYVRGRGHVLFRAESLLNTPLFVGFPGFVSKLWLSHDEQGAYRGIYQWDGAARAERYARSLWRVLALVSEPGSIHYVVLPGLVRDSFVNASGVLDDRAPTTGDTWWRTVVSNMPSEGGYERMST